MRPAPSGPPPASPPSGPESCQYYVPPPDIAAAPPTDERLDRRHDSVSASDAAIVAAIVFVWGALSARLERYDVTAPIIFGACWLASG